MTEQRRPHRLRGRPVVHSWGADKISPARQPGSVGGRGGSGLGVPVTKPVGGRSASGVSAAGGGARPTAFLDPKPKTRSDRSAQPGTRFGRSLRPGTESAGRDEGCRRPSSAHLRGQIPPRESTRPVAAPGHGRRSQGARRDAPRRRPRSRSPVAPPAGTREQGRDAAGGPRDRGAGPGGRGGRRGLEVIADRRFTARRGVAPGQHVASRPGSTAGSRGVPTPRPDTPVRGD